MEIKKQEEERHGRQESDCERLRRARAELSCTMYVPRQDLCIVNILRWSQFTGLKSLKLAKIINRP